MRTSVALYLLYVITLLVALGFKSFSEYQPTNDEDSTSSLPPIRQNNFGSGGESSFREILFVTPAGDIFFREQTGLRSFSASPAKFTAFPDFAFVGGTPSGTAFVATLMGKVREVTATGETKWETQISSPVAGAAVSSTGELYIGGGTTLYAFSSDHRKLWQWDYPAEPNTYPEIVLQQVCVGSNGTVYVETNHGKVVALDSSGRLLWQITVGSEGSLPSSLVTDAQGHLYHCDRKHLAAISREGAILWQYRIPADPSFSFGLELVPVISSDGDIYIARKSLFSIGPDGRDRWRFHPDTPHEYFETAPTIGKDGTVYLFSSAKQYGRMYAVSREGKKLWSYQFHENEYAARPARFGPDGYLWKANAGGFLVFSVR